MKYLNIIMFVVIILFACNNHNSNDSKIESVGKDTIKSIVDSAVTIPKQSTSDSLTVPSKQFLRLAKQIDSAGFIWDTTRIKNVTHYFRTDSVIVAETYVFYKMQLKDSWLEEFFDKSTICTWGCGERVLSIKECFKKAKSITGYYYKQKEKANLMVDGYIEEWVFPNPKEAQTAAFIVTKMKDVIYFNTQSFCYRIDEKVYTFHVRAMGFSPQLKKFFKQFVKDNKAMGPKD